MINHISPLPEFLIIRYKKWFSSLFLKKESKFKKLASYGQKPKTMVISCCDSRVHATSIFGSEAGEFFIHRNIANLVPPYSTISENYGTAAALEYAINILKVEHLIILGHLDCGGIKCAHDLHSSKKNPKYIFINKWLSLLQPAYKKISFNVSKKKQIKQLEEESIKHSLKNLLNFPFIKKAVESKHLSIHGLIHDIGSGKLKYLNPDTNLFENL